MTENTHEDPDTGSVTGAPVTEVEESDPNADSPEGLAGDMGVSSERLGRVRGVEEEVTYGAAPTHPEEQQTGETPPEQSAFDGRPEVNPDSPGAHESDPDSNPRHGV
ncbi:MAG: hypothetical protein ABWX73_05510 [Marmoricola sp.]